MKGGGTVVLAIMILVAAPRAFGQPAPYVEEEILRDVRRQQHDIEAEAARQRQLEQSEHVRETVERPPLPEQRPVGGALQERLLIVQDQIQKLQGERALAVEQKKTAEEIAAIDARIAQLEQEASRLKAGPGLTAE